MCRAKLIRNHILFERGYYNKLKMFFWNDKFIENLRQINIEKYSLGEQNSKIKTLRDIYMQGLNYGNCGLSCRYLLKLFDLYKIKAELHYGSCSILEGCFRSPNGEHSFIKSKGLIYCPTLMISIPIALSDLYGFKTTKIIAPDNSKELSEYSKFEEPQIISI